MTEPILEAGRHAAENPSFWQAAGTWAGSVISSVVTALIAVLKMSQKKFDQLWKANTDLKEELGEEKVKIGVLESQRQETERRLKDMGDDIRDMKRGQDQMMTTLTRIEARLPERRRD